MSEHFSTAAVNVLILIMKEIEEDKYAVIGGFYITRYGVFMTSAHVLDELVDRKEQKIARSRSFGCHPASEDPRNPLGLRNSPPAFPG